MASIHAGNPNRLARGCWNGNIVVVRSAIVARKMARYDMENSKWLCGIVPPSFHLWPDAEEYGLSEF